MTSPWNFNTDTPQRQKLWITKPIFVIMMGIFVVLGLTFFWYNMKNRMDEVDEANIPVITNDNSVFKMKPDHPGGYVSPHADKMVYSLINKNKKAEIEPNRLAIQDEEEPLIMQPPEEKDTREEISSDVGQKTMSNMFGSFTIQIASLSGKQAADKEWSNLKKKYPDLLGQQQGLIQEASINNKTVFRIYVGQFEDAAEANQLCQKLQNQSVSCLVKKI